MLLPAVMPKPDPRAGDAAAARTIPANESPWQAEVKIESLVEDIRQIFVEVDAQWAVPSPWAPEEIIRRTRVAYDFANTQVVGFLKGFEPDSAIEYVVSGDAGRLVHTGLVSVQLQPPAMSSTVPLQSLSLPSQVVSAPSW